jgi:hypothetical protein
MRVTLTPNDGHHQIVCDTIMLKTIEQVETHIRHLQTIRDMLWGNQNDRTDNEQAATGEETTPG